jgi:predicted TIM-barrel fold metal-dependent hydrolase
MKVFDFQHHYVPLALAERHGYAPGRPADFMQGGLKGATLHDRLVDLDWQLRDMDAGHIDVAVLSCVVGWDAPLADCRLINDDVARVEERYPGRFLGLANVPFDDSGSAAAEVRRAVRELGLRGVAISSQVRGGPLDAPELGDFYRAVQELDVPIFVHPAALPEGYAWTRDYDLGRILGRELDLQVAATRLIVGGVLEEFPRLRFVVAHFGGGIAAVKDRLEAKAFRFGTLKRPFGEYFARLAFDAGGFEGAAGPLTAALTGIAPRQIVFATDYPQDFTGVQTATERGPAAMAEYVELFRGLPYSEEDRAWMLGGYAASLLKLDERPHPHVAWA